MTLQSHGCNYLAIVFPLSFIFIHFKTGCDRDAGTDFEHRDMR